ncbi:MAG: NADH-quinone oxidoreductase, subunit M [Candidatus Aeolococcus gillhamiae]|uniref:NADH-quinone oxidoreductase, subunit M n=1 Tax=Candidatus Aeolococcus gillhamiae TaxID=3127015 RepID=A0A2W6ARA8_9BACT|nr:MAG: NADH-quinone oxidoreductase, subunit M [Candidatus Dormibacter sp. RRmetagenome_bin12]
MNIPWLTVVLAVPLGGSLLLQLIPRGAATVLKAFTIAATLATAILVWVLVATMSGTRVSPGALGFHYEEIHTWIPAIGAGYHLGLDGISAWILALNAGVFLLGALIVSRRSTDRLKLFCGLLLLTETMTAGVLLSVDLLLFYLFWEGMLIPLYFVLANYGNENRGRATLKFVIYTVAGSLLMLLAIIALGVASGRSSFDLTALLGGPLSRTPVVIPGLNITTFTPEQWAFLAFAAAFAIKIPIVPFHTWLPDLYESAPVPVLVFFAGLVSKLGAYGFIRFGLTLFPDAINTFKWLLAALAVLSIIYGALMALSQTDLKRIVAYSSLSHLGFIALGIFTLTTNGVNGAVIQIVNHGIIIAALFIIVGIVEERTGTRDIRELSGLEKRMPWLYALFLVATLAGLGMPGMNSFAGEFSIMLGAFQLHPVYAVLAGVGVVLACWYMLRLHQGLMHDPPQPRTEGVRDVRVSQGLVLLPLIALMVLLGVFPRPVGDIARPSVERTVAVANSSLTSTAVTNAGAP